MSIGNRRGFGWSTRGRVLALLALIVAASESPGRADGPRIGARLDPGASIAFPATPSVLDVTKPPYGARGDGKADDTDALQRAFADSMGQHKVVYLPEGTYLVSKTIRWAKKNASGADAWGFNWLQGQNPLKTAIRLKDGTFTDPARAEPILWCGGFGSADWFHNYVQGVTFDVGRDNPGAIGLQFYSNNTGAVRDVSVVSRDGKGAIGLDLAPADMNGPLLVRNVEVKGFELGIRTGGSVNSQTFERIRLEGQTRYGIHNQGQSVSFRGVSFEGEVPAIKADSFTVMIDSELSGKAGAKDHPAILVGKGNFFARDVITRGFQKALTTELGGPGVLGPEIDEFFQGQEGNLFGAKSRSLRLAVKETPDVPRDDPSTWAVVDSFGADPTGGRDSSRAIQKAIDSGATTVFFPGAYALEHPVRVRGKVRRLLGVGNWIDYNHVIKPDLIVGDGDSPVVVIEHFAPINGGISIETNRTIVFRSLEAPISLRGKGEIFFEDVVTGGLEFSPGQKVWARQLNVENEGTHLKNSGAALWVLGYKTERGGTLLHTRAGGKSEVLGNFSYTTTAGKLAPMFVTEDASVFAFFHEICYSGDPFAVFVKETRRGTTRTIPSGKGGIAPYVAGPAASSR